MRLLSNKSGSVLLYSLLIISLITAIAITVSIIVINELKLTSGAANATLAYYAAESGIEKGLYTIKIMRNDGSTLSDAVAEISLFPKGGEAAFENNADYSDGQTKSKTSEIVNEEIKENQYVQADYYDVNSPLAPTNEVKYITVKNDDSVSSAWAEVSWTAWDGSGTLGTSTSARKVIGPTDLYEVWPIDLEGAFSDPFDPVGYRLRIRALFDDLSAVTVMPYDGLPPPPGGGVKVADLHSQIEIKSVGERGKFKQSLTATVPWKIPLSGLYDYVLFSEGDILKTIILSQPAYSSGTIQIEASLGSTQECRPDCADCLAVTWDGLSCGTKMYCYGAEAVPYSEEHQVGVCYLGHDGNAREFTLPIPTLVTEGEEYYVSLRMWYMCNDDDDDGTCNDPHTPPRDRKIAVEIFGQSVVVDDQADTLDQVWRTCTIPESFSVGNSSLPVGDPSRSIKFSTISGGATQWWGYDWMGIDWYQLSTYKIFEDCE
jgi:hypothetical protein